MGVMDGGTRRALMLTAAVMGAAGCAQVGDAIYTPRSPNARSTVIDGEIRAVDPRRGRIQVRSARLGTRTVRVDRSTRILYRRVEYRVEALERGDLVRVFAEVDGSGIAWAERVDVRASVDERRDHPDRRAYARDYVWLAGNIVRMDPADGWFTIDSRREGEIIVYVPDRLDREDERRLGRMHRGDQVEVEVRMITNDEAELVTFR
jgi:hypothetical protein